jgi:hypothetical protein
MCVLASSVIDHGFEPRSDQTIKEKEQRLVDLESG